MYKRQELGETFRSTHGAGALQLPALGLFHSAVDAQGLQKAGEQEVQIVDAGDFLHDQAQDVGDTCLLYTSHSALGFLPMKNIMTDLMSTDHLNCNVIHVGVQQNMSLLMLVTIHSQQLLRCV